MEISNFLHSIHLYASILLFFTHFYTEMLLVCIAFNASATRLREDNHLRFI